jgi:uncharacterized protein Yka (UPF0111/DUF47 family)
LNLRGRYGGGPYVVTSRRWWSRKDREAARIAAKVLEHEGDRIRAGVREKLRRALIYGE